MNFLPDVYVPCEVCHGARYNRETLEVHYKGKSISEILDMAIEEAAEFFAAIPAINRHLKTLVEVGLGYVRLGQPAPTLSGGEAQRVKLASELQKRSTGRTLYVLDEPTTGLHFEDIRKLLGVLGRLVDAGNTVVVIEHNLDVIKTADWVIDMGPEGGSRGGKIIAEGTPEQIAANGDSYTGMFLKPILDGRAVPVGAAQPELVPAVPTTAKGAATKAPAKRAAAREGPGAAGELEPRSNQKHRIVRLPEGAARPPGRDGAVGWPAPEPRANDRNQYPRMEALHVRSSPAARRRPGDHAPHRSPCRGTRRAGGWWCHRSRRLLGRRRRCRSFDLRPGVVSTGLVLGSRVIVGSGVELRAGFADGHQDVRGPERSERRHR